MMKWFLILLLTAFAGMTYAQPHIIFDTDMGSDCDDAGALAVLHQLANKGEALILGVIYSSGKNKYGVGVCDAINNYYNRGDILLGQYKGSDIGDPGNPYSEAIATNITRFPHQVIDSAMELVKAYKIILYKQPDTSVTIVTLGHPYGLAKLMADTIGRALVKQKVKAWVGMTYTDTIPKQDWNFGKNGAAPCITGLLKDWPTPIYLSSYGTNIITGNKKLPATADDNPVKEAYHLWKNSLTTGRASWDPITVLFAVRPQYFALENGQLLQNSNYQTYWKANSNDHKMHRVKPLMNDLEFTNMIEKLMAGPPVKIKANTH